VKAARIAEIKAKQAAELAALEAEEAEGGEEEQAPPDGPVTMTTESFDSMLDNLLQP
jgi:hypothetical protein